MGRGRDSRPVHGANEAIMGRGRDSRPEHGANEPVMGRGRDSRPVYSANKAVMGSSYGISLYWAHLKPVRADSTAGHSAVWKRSVHYEEPVHTDKVVLCPVPE